MIPALVLTAGLATRLRPLSLVRAKSALPVGGMPLAGRILRQLAAAGVTEAVMNLHHLPASLTSRIGDGSDIGVRVRYSWEAPVVLGSAGGPRKALGLLDSSTFLIVNGDTLTNLDIGALVAAHRQSNALVTIAVVPNTSQDQYSGVEADEHGHFIGVVPRGSSAPSFHVIGAQVAESRAFAQLEDGQPFESIAALYPALVRERPDAVRIHHCVSTFLDIGTANDYFVSCRALAPVGNGIIEKGARGTVHPTARVLDAIVWDDVDIEADVQMTHVIATDGVRIPAGTHWSNVILRRAESTLLPNEQRVGNLAVTPLMPS